MKCYARVSVNVPQVSGCFDYKIPVGLINSIEIGFLVEVPFGKQIVQGVIVELLETSVVEITKDILGLIDINPVLTQAQILFAETIAESYYCTYSQAIELMVPSGLNQQADILITLTGTTNGKSLSQLESKIVDQIHTKGSVRGRQLDSAFPRVDWKTPLKRLQQKGILEYHSFLPKPTIRPQLVRTVQICAGEQEIQEYQLEIQDKKVTSASERRNRIIAFLQKEPEPIPVQWVYAETACTMVDLQYLAANDMVTLGETEWIRDPVAKINVIAEKDITLTNDQALAWSEVTKDIDQMSIGNNTKPILLFGVTGSGKTEIYLRAAEKVVSQGKKVIILVPEISLTPQTVRRFINRFPGRVGLYHSRLSAGERYDTWRRARAGKIDVMVGPRSALFTPFTDIGLIIVDECHDDSYCQGDYGVYYDCRVLAEQYSRNQKALCIFGSATPNVSQLYDAIETGWNVIKLPERIRVSSPETLEPVLPVNKIPNMGELPTVQVVDMREELKTGNISLLSLDLQKSLSNTVKDGHQAILYLNRRGKATYVFCRNCGYVLVCPRCDLTLTLHGDKNELICHQCGYKRGQPKICPACNSATIRQLGVGTETVEAAVRKLLPDANILRWDAETSRYKDAHEIILSHFMNHRADILIGTQMISKGLDFPMVTLVGVILAETGLSLPDYRATERTFQLLTQVAGRAGRSDLGGKVVFQTYQPDNYVIEMASHYDYDQFYIHELEYRRRLGYPPYYQLVKLEISNQSPDVAEATAIHITHLLVNWMESSKRQASELVGPVPCYFGKVNNIYRWQIILRGTNPGAVIKEHLSELTGIRIEVNPPNLL
jgi:primosomal protein N' (replication factor Y) (superfamily II helicase)